MEPTTVLSHTDSDHSSVDNDSIPSIHPSDSASNHGGEKDTEIVEIVEILHRVPRTVRRSTINHRLHELQLKSNELTIMFNEESTYQRDRDDELASAQRVEWIARCIEVINDTSKIQVEIIDHHLSKRKKLECLDYTASLKQIEEWLEQIAAIWARTHNQLRLYSFLLNDNNLLDTEALMLDVRRSFCLLVHESFWIAEPPPEVIVLEKQFDTAVATLIPKAFGNLKLTFKASIVNLDQFYRDVQNHKVKSGEFYNSPNAILENDELTLSVAQSSGYVKFKNLTLQCFARSDFKEREFDSRYHLLYQMVVHFPDLEMCLSCRLISDSVTVVEPCEEATALAFLSDSMESKSNLRSHSILGSEKRRDIIQVS